jgi:transposase
MGTSRFVIRDHQWAKVEPHCLGQKSHPRRMGSDTHLFIKVVFWIALTGWPWRDPPPGFGHWNRIYRNFRDRARSCVLERMLNDSSGQPYIEMAAIDGTIVKVYRAGQGAKGGLSIKR